ncbi:unnamed protein product, partial [Polarella glacialis]
GAGHTPQMPLCKIFSRRALNVSAPVLHDALARIWGVSATPNVLKVLSLPFHDASGSTEEVYVDIRAKAKPERTPEVVDEACQKTAELLSRYGHPTVVRAELYEPSLQYSATKDAE